MFTTTPATQSTMFGGATEFTPTSFSKEQMEWGQMMVGRGIPSGTVQSLLTNYWRFAEQLAQSQAGNINEAIQSLVEQEQRQAANFGAVKVLIYGKAEPRDGQVIADVLSVEGIKAQDATGNVYDATSIWNELQTKFNKTTEGQLSASVILDEQSLDILEDARNDGQTVSGYFLPNGVVTLGLAHKNFSRDFGPELKGKKMYKDPEGNFTAVEEGNSPVKVIRMGLTGSFQSLAPSKNDISAATDLLFAALEDTANLKQRGVNASRARRALENEMMNESDAPAEE
jgi:hypothetical protein